MNEAIRDTARAYVGPPVQHYSTLQDALAAWGQEITDE